MQKGFAASVDISGHFKTNVNVKEVFDSDVEFSTHLTPFERIKRAATFWARTAPIVAQYYGTLQVFSTTIYLNITIEFLFILSSNAVNL
jgi:hypothetical protein